MIKFLKKLFLKKSINNKFYSLKLVDKYINIFDDLNDYVDFKAIMKLFNYDYILLIGLENIEKLKVYWISDDEFRDVSNSLDMFHKQLY